MKIIWAKSVKPKIIDKAFYLKNYHVCKCKRKEAKMAKKKITKNEKEEIIKCYKTKPMTYQELAENFGYSHPTICKILKEYRIKPYNKVQLFSPNLVEDYFEHIDSEFKAYFLGLIITDGCIFSKGSRQNLVNLTLKDSDCYILEEFKKEVKSNKKITSDGRGCKSIQILSNKMVKDLKQYGLADNKSCKTIFPKNIPLHLFPHLIRGIFDGDGSVAFYARSNRKCHNKAFRFCQGNKKFLLDLIDFLEKHFNIERVQIFQEKENLWSIAYRKNTSLLKLYHCMYDEATIYLKRKKELGDKIVKEIAYYQGNTEITNFCKKN